MVWIGARRLTVGFSAGFSASFSSYSLVHKRACMHVHSLYKCTC